MIGHPKLTTVVSVGFCLFGFQVIQADSSLAVTRITGLTSQLGDGTVTSYAEIDELNVPKAIGVVFTAAALENLPTTPSDGNRCLDSNSDGQIDLANECAAWHERVLPLPTELSQRPDMPFKWVLLNWNPNGHIPHGIYEVFLQISELRNELNREKCPNRPFWQPFSGSDQRNGINACLSKKR